MTHEEFKKIYKFEYNDEHNIGSGSFSKVFKAKYKDRDRYEYAIKKSELQIINGKTFSLEDEFKVIKDLDPHENIAYYKEVHKIMTDSGPYDFIVMKYYPYGNLKKMLFNEGLIFENEEKMIEELTFNEREKIAVGILNGISFLHKNNRVHRDLKPANILIDFDEKYNAITPLITDFGLSKIVDGQIENVVENSMGQGTPGYSSPEQISGDPKIYINTDLWAFGVIAYEVLTGISFFNAKNNTSSNHKIIDRILKDDFTSKLKVLPENWRKAISVCLIKDPKKRIKTANEVLKIINTRVEKPSIEITQPSGSDRLGKIIVISPVGKDFSYSLNDKEFQSSKTFENLNEGSYSIKVKNNSGTISEALKFQIKNEDTIVRVNKKGIPLFEKIIKKLIIKILAIIVFIILCLIVKQYLVSNEYPDDSNANTEIPIQKTAKIEINPNQITYACYVENGSKQLKNGNKSFVNDDSYENNKIFKVIHNDITEFGVKENNIEIVVTDSSNENLRDIINLLNKNKYTFTEKNLKSN